MVIQTFTEAHWEDVQKLARAMLEEEIRYTPALDGLAFDPDFTPLIRNGLGAVAFEGSKLVGYMGCLGPFRPWGIKHIKGVFSPCHGNGAVKENREEVYARMYQYAARKWVEAGVSSHSICVYAHNREAKNQLFRYGFGLRCVDAIQDLQVLKETLAKELIKYSENNYTFTELPLKEIRHLLELNNAYLRYMAGSPTFLRFHSTQTLEEFLADQDRKKYRYFAARDGEKIIASMALADQGETLLTEDPGLPNLSDAICLGKYRGQGISQQILSHIVHVLQAEGYKKLGVDYESLNPATKFWEKYFIPYTDSLARRIDETALEK